MEVNEFFERNSTNFFGDLQVNYKVIQEEKTDKSAYCNKNLCLKT